MKKNIEYIKTLISELGKEKAKEEYLEEIMQEEKNKYPYELLGEFFDNIK